MMVRNVSVSYCNTFAMSLPGFLPNVGDMLGQRTGGGMQPGLDFAFGLTGESYIDKAKRAGMAAQQRQYQYAGHHQRHGGPPT